MGPSVVQHEFAASRAPQALEAHWRTSCKAALRRGEAGQSTGARNGRVGSARPDCAEPCALKVVITGDDGEVLLAEGAEVKRAKGCSRCHGTGYKGRTGMFEILEIDDDMRESVKARSGKKVYRDMVRQGGLVPLREAGLRRVKEGITSLDEVLRVT